MTTNEKPRELLIATTLLWAALATGVLGTVLDSTSLPAETSLAAFLVIDAMLVLVTAAATYYFFRGRNWARIASLILFVMALLGTFELPSLFERSAIAAWLYVGTLLMQAAAMYLAFATDASKCFRHTPADDVALRAVLPVGRSGWAIAAGYLALFSVLLVPAPFALAAGLLAMRDIKRHPEKHGMGRAIFGVVMGSLGVLVMIVLFVIRQTR